MSTSATLAAARPVQGWVTATLLRIRSEYQEMPGLCLTTAQAQRLCGLDGDTCREVLAALVDVGFLRLTTHGYVRA